MAVANCRLHVMDFAAASYAPSDTFAEASCRLDLMDLPHAANSRPSDTFAARLSPDAAHIDARPPPHAAN